MILRKPQGEKFSEVIPAWKGETCVLIGGGPSLTSRDVDLVSEAHADRSVRCIAVNDAYLLAPWADVVYFADSHWWRWMTEGIDKPLLGLTAAQVREKFGAFKGQKCSIQNSGGNITDEAVHIMRNRDFPQHGDGLSLDPQELVTGRHGGFQALNLAVLAGAKLIVLLGYDGKPGVDGKTHFHGEHPRPTPVAAYPQYRRWFAHAVRALGAAGVHVINATPGSAIDSFPMMDLDDVLAQLRCGA